MTNIGDQVIQDKLSKNLITHDLQLQLDRAIINNLKSQLLKDSDKDALVLKFNQVSEYMRISNITLDDMQKDFSGRNKELGQKVANIVKIVLNVLDTIWLIINELESAFEKNTELNSYYTSVTNSLLLKTKILHVSVLIATYDNPSFVNALESLKELLKSRYEEAEVNLNEVNNQLKKYNDIGPEFQTLNEAYKSLMYKIQAAKDDIDRITNN